MSDVGDRTHIPKALVDGKDQHWNESAQSAKHKVVQHNRGPWLSTMLVSSVILNQSVITIVSSVPAHRALRVE